MLGEHGMDHPEQTHLHHEARAVRAAQADARVGTDPEGAPRQQCEATAGVAPPDGTDQHRLCPHGGQQESKLSDHVQGHVLQGEPLDVGNSGPGPRARSSRH
uniref:(northern house mosquito) hypothetical protein n=1 Tax=Culex pipiens TaxID=7175 RepID=A0A8D8FUD9_CULPI